MKPPVLCAIFAATLISSNCLAQQEESASSAGQQTGQTNESSPQNTDSSPSPNSATGDNKVIIDKAPSGNEQAEKTIGSSTGASVTMPGRDAPVSETTQDNGKTMDFSVSDPSKASEDDTTIIIERQEPQPAPSTQSEQNKPDHEDTQPDHQDSP